MTPFPSQNISFIGFRFPQYIQLIRILIGQHFPLRPTYDIQHGVLHNYIWSQVGPTTGHVVMRNTPIKSNRIRRNFRQRIPQLHHPVLLLTSNDRSQLVAFAMHVYVVSKNIRALSLILIIHLLEVNLTLEQITTKSLRKLNKNRESPNIPN